MKDEFAGGLTQALRVSRTETLRAYRQASQRTYKANPDTVEGWVWLANLGSWKRTCSACIAMHGTIFPTNIIQGTHPNCRCTLAPRSRSLAEILGDPTIPDTRPVIVPGPEWFAALPEERQRWILTAGGTTSEKRFQAYREGRITLGDCVHYHDHPEWGPTRREAGLANALENAKKRQETGWDPAGVNPAALTTSSAGGGQVPPPTTPSLAAAEPPPHNPDWERRVEQYRASDRFQYAGRRNLSDAEYDALADAHMKTLICGTKLFMRVEPDALEKVLQGEPFKNLFDTGTSRGINSPPDRMDTEAALWGIPLDAIGVERPVYGYLHHRRNGISLGVEEDKLEQYGKIAVQFKAKVRRCATFTTGDSMDETDRGYAPTLVASPVERPRWLSVHEYLGDPLKYPDAATLVHAAESEMAYIEAHFHGELLAADIKEVTFLGPEPSPELLELLVAAKVPYRVVK